MKTQTNDFKRNKGFTIKRSSKYGCLYQVWKNTLFQAVDEMDKDGCFDWVEVSSSAFNEKEREEFDTYIEKLFGYLPENIK